MKRSFQCCTDSVHAFAVAQQQNYGANVTCTSPYTAAIYVSHTVSELMLVFLSLLCSRDSEQSMRSSTGLLASSSPRNASFDSSLQPSSADSLHHSPNTATTIVSNPEQNPFDFSNNAGLSGHVVLHTGSQPVLHPHQDGANMDYSHPVGTNMDYPAGTDTDYPHPAGTNMEYPQGTEYPMYPILEDPPTRWPGCFPP